MTQQQYQLEVQDDLQERQLRRLGAAVSLLWDQLPDSAKAAIVRQASVIEISGETGSSDTLEDQIVQFLESNTIGRA